METGFNDPLKTKNEKRSVKNPWSFKCPQYDERSSCYVNAGTDYGVGVNQPIGHAGDPKSAGVPKGRVNTLKTYPNEEKATIE
jgi:hypothetical protein